MKMQIRNKILAVLPALLLSLPAAALPELTVASGDPADSAAVPSSGTYGENLPPPQGDVSRGGAAGRAPAPERSYGSDPSSYEEKYFSGREYTLSSQEKAALKIAEDFRMQSARSRPISGKAGEIVYVYGAQTLDIVCAVLQVCDIALQPGEQINTLHIGDSSRWYMEPAVTGSGVDEIQHIIVKPLDVGLKTSLVVTTNRRTYHMNLGSHKTRFMPLVTFTYPDEIRNKFQRFRSSQTSAAAAQTLPSTGEAIENLDFDYEIDGAGQSWTPVRVYNNGRQTVIELPEKVSSGEIPTFMVQDPATDRDVLVNYRYIGHKFIVDAIFQKAVLIVGVGSDQQKVTITRK